MSDMAHVRWPRRWPLILLALPAGVATWSGWVGLGEKTGFGPVKLFPGISDFTINSAITLPIGVEAYAAFALNAWLTSAPMSASTRRFARTSALGALAFGMLGQVAYHLLEASGHQRAPWWITTLVSCLPVLVVGLGAGLAHMMNRDRTAQRREAADASGRPDVETDTCVRRADTTGGHADMAVRPGGHGVNGHTRVSAPSALSLTTGDVQTPGRLNVGGVTALEAELSAPCPPQVNGMSAPCPPGDSIDADAGMAASPDTRTPASADADTQPDTHPDTETDADAETDRPSIAAAVASLLRQGVSDPDEVAAQVPEIVGHPVARSTVTRTLRRHRAARAPASHGGYL